MNIAINIVQMVGLTYVAGIEIRPYPAIHPMSAIATILPKILGPSAESKTLHLTSQIDGKKEICKTFSACLCTQHGDQPTTLPMAG